MKRSRAKQNEKKKRSASIHFYAEYFLLPCYYFSLSLWKPLLICFESRLAYCSLLDCSLRFIVCVWDSWHNVYRDAISAHAYHIHYIEIDIYAIHIDYYTIVHAIEKNFHIWLSFFFSLSFFLLTFFPLWKIAFTYILYIYCYHSGGIRFDLPLYLF